jgi:site-specific recombinase XerD
MKISETDFISFISIKKNLSFQSIRHCKIRFKVIEKWFGDEELNKQLVEDFFMELKNKGQGNNSLNTYYFVFRHLRDYCIDRGLPSNFLDGFTSFKKTKPDIIIFTLEEIENILNTKLSHGKLAGRDCSFLDFRYKTLTMFLAYTGCRYSEAAELQIKRLDLSAGRAIFINTKTNENRSVYFTDPLKSDLRKLVEGKNPNDFVFRNSKEKKVHVGDFSEDLKRRGRTAGVIKRVFPHNFRHSYITHLLEAGVPITEVASLVGHKDIQTTYSTYMHLADKTLERAALRHPAVRRNVAPTEIIRNFKELIDNQHFENDPRFIYEISQGQENINIRLKIKK